MRREGSVLLVDFTDGPSRDQAFGRVVNIKRVLIELAGGNEKLRIAENVREPVVALGGNGNDILSSRSANMTLSGGDGKDYARVRRLTTHSAFEYDSQLGVD